MKRKVAVLMSGGVDSSVAAYLLLKNYEVVGVTLKLWKCEEFTVVQRQLCCSPQDVSDAKNVCLQLGIKHYVFSLYEEFKKYIIEEFCKNYLEGKTPNPCVWCNAKIKFSIAFKRIKETLGIEYIASGHYAKVCKIDNNFFILRGKDEFKEQSYFLCQIPKEVLPNLILPLGDYYKKDIRQIAKELELKVAKKKESFDLCFIPAGDYRKFLESKGYLVKNKGKILDIETKRFLGYHNGYLNYTIGQKAGLKNLPYRMYVVSIDPINNIIYVGTKEKLFSYGLIAKNCIFYEKKEKIFQKKLFAKIRYKSELAECVIDEYEEGIKVKFLQPQRAITKGQYVVIYDEEGKVVCSGEILDIY